MKIEASWGMSEEQHEHICTVELFYPLKLAVDRQLPPWPVLTHQVCPAALQESASSPRSSWASDWLSWPKGLSSPWVYRDHDCRFAGFFNTQGHKRLYLLNSSIFIIDHHKCYAKIHIINKVYISTSQAIMATINWIAAINIKATNSQPSLTGVGTITGYYNLIPSETSLSTISSTHAYGRWLIQIYNTRVKWVRQIAEGAKPSHRWENKPNWLQKWAQRVFSKIKERLSRQRLSHATEHAVCQLYPQWESKIMWRVHVENSARLRKKKCMRHALFTVVLLILHKI